MYRYLIISYIVEKFKKINFYVKFASSIGEGNQKRLPLKTNKRFQREGSLAGSWTIFAHEIAHKRQSSFGQKCEPNFCFAKKMVRLTKEYRKRMTSKEVILFCERLPKRSRIEVKKTKSNVLWLLSLSIPLFNDMKSRIV